MEAVRFEPCKRVGLQPDNSQREWPLTRTNRVTCKPPNLLRVGLSQHFGVHRHLPEPPGARQASLPEWDGNATAGGFQETRPHGTSYKAPIPFLAVTPQPLQLLKRVPSSFDALDEPSRQAPLSAPLFRRNLKAAGVPSFASLDITASETPNASRTPTGRASGAQ